MLLVVLAGKPIVSISVAGEWKWQPMQEMHQPSSIIIGHNKPNLCICLECEGDSASWQWKYEVHVQV